MAREDSNSRSWFSQANGPLRFVVEGVGDVVKNFYDPAFQELQRKLDGRQEICVTFTDKSEFWRHDLDLANKMRSIIASIKSWGADYLDKSDPADLVKYKDLEADVVIIATPDFTHVEVAEEWLKRQPRPEQIFIEKPLDVSVDNTRRLLGKVKPYDSSILAFDHYRVRLLPGRYEMHALLDFLDQGIRRFTFYFLEDRSGGDPNYQPLVQRDGAIENEQRVQTLNQGVILDDMPHIIAILAHFGRVETLRVTRVRAGQYIGVDGDRGKRTEIERETFADVGFVCVDYAGNAMEGTTYVGKGVRGVRALGPEYDHDTKVLDIEGLKGNKVRFDLKGASKAFFIGTHLQFGLYSKPYETFLEKVAKGTYLNDRLALNVEVGKRMLEIIEDMRFPILELDKNRLPTYESGMKGGRQSLYLKEILDRLPILYGVS